jgi:UDP-N-acetylglucosamine/UDP-N-acetylgalactosamine diphosphorylase
MIQTLIARGVHIPAPAAIVLENIGIEQIKPGVTLYPGTVLRGPKTYIGKNAVIGLGGGAFIDNAQIGERAQIMQGVYRQCTLLDDVVVRNGAEIREGTLLEEGVELGHTVGLKQTIMLSHVVAGSLINFCDALMAGGTSRKNHSEIGSCMALYNFTPQGDKFASLFGDIEKGIFLKQPPIFVGGQTQIVSPVEVGYGSVIAAGSKITRNLESKQIIAQSQANFQAEFDPEMIYAPDHKLRVTQHYIYQLKLLQYWYQNVRLKLFTGTDKEFLMLSALERIQSGIDERQKRLKKFVEKLPKSLELHQKNGNLKQIQAHQTAMELSANPIELNANDAFMQHDFEAIVTHLRTLIRQGKSYPEAMSLLADV